jgi:hypothetical protein
VNDVGDMMNIQVIIEGSMNSSNPYFSSSWRRNFMVRKQLFFSFLCEMSYLPSFTPSLTLFGPQYKFINYAKVKMSYISDY